MFIFFFLQSVKVAHMDKTAIALLDTVRSTAIAHMKTEHVLIDVNLVIKVTYVKQGI